MFRIVVLATATAALSYAECVMGPETRQGRLIVSATGLTGTPLKDIFVELAPVGQPAANIKGDARGTRLTYGQYELRVYASGFASVRRNIRIHQPELAVRVELPVGTIGCPPEPADIGGRITRNNQAGELWVKAIPVNGVGGGETRVSESGYFVISGLEYSTYVVLVMKGNAVLYQQVVKTYPAGSRESANLAIDLTAIR